MLKTTAKNPVGVQSVRRAFAILHVLAQRPEGMGVSDIARRLHLKVPTVHNLLKTLIDLHYVTKEEDAALYRLGYACAILGRHYLRGADYIRLARRHMEQLARELDETILLAIMQNGEVAFVARTESRRMLTVNPGTGWVRDGYASVCGRILLAFANPSTFEAYVRTHPISETSAPDISSREDLDRIMRKVRRDEFVFQWREGKTVAAMAAPVRDASGRVIAAIGLAMPAVRYRKARKGRIEKLVSDAARRISSELGYQE